MKVYTELPSNGNSITIMYISEGEQNPHVITFCIPLCTEGYVSTQTANLEKYGYKRVSFVEFAKVCEGCSNV